MIGNIFRTSAIDDELDRNSGDCAPLNPFCVYDYNMAMLVWYWQVYNLRL